MKDYVENYIVELYNASLEELDNNIECLGNSEVVDLQERIKFLDNILNNENKIVEISSKVNNDNELTKLTNELIEYYIYH